jgi:glycosyltransferase involved in cell wall biosynthesis/SAM-dependent methyltransferase
MAAGWEVHLAVPPGEHQDEIVHPSITTHRVDLIRSIGPLHQEVGSLLELYRLCKRLRPDLIHTLGPKATVVGGLVGRVLRIPTMMTKGGVGTAETQPGLGNFLARWVIRWAIVLSLTKRAMLVTQNPDERRANVLFKGHLERSVIVPGAGVDCSVFKPAAEPLPPVRVLFLGRLLRSKGIAEFVAAARRVKHQYSQTRFLIAGEPDPGNSTSVQRDELLRWQAEGVVEWLGYRDDVPALLASCHVVCFPSYGEGVPKALIEAAAAGRCIVTTDAPGCREVVEHGVNGLLTRPGDVEGLAMAVGKVVASPGLRRAYGAAGRDRALKHFDQRIVLAQTLALYETVISHDRERPTARLAAYFSRSYPTHKSLLGRTLLRHGEAERRHILRGLLGNLDGLAVLDAGCGNGTALSAAIQGRPRLIQLEDISPDAADEAATQFTDRADRIVPVVADAFSRADSFDVVLAIGVLDYQTDAAGPLACLLQRSHGVLVVTLPRLHLRNWARSIWFKVLRVPFCTLDRTAAHRLAIQAARPFELVKGPFEWFIRFEATQD